MVTMRAREEAAMGRPRVLRTIASRIAERPASPVTLVAVDGVDGAGKTTFADELVTHLEELGTSTVRASVDGFHRPRRERHRRGRRSPEGFFLDSHDLDAFRARLLDPLRPGGDLRIVRAIHDVDRDRALHLDAEPVAQGTVLVVDGIFLHRSELGEYWHHSVFLEVPFEISLARVADRDGTDADVQAPSNRRYVEGQRLYLRSCRPQRHASFVVDNTDLAAPILR
jgi:uridine kinase